MYHDSQGSEGEGWEGEGVEMEIPTMVVDSGAAEITGGADGGLGEGSWSYHAAQGP